MISSNQITILLFAVRFVLFAMIYVGGVLWWAMSEGGHGAMGIFSAGVLLSGAAAAAWIAALVIGRYIASSARRFVIHIAMVIALFTMMGAGIFMFLDIRAPLAHVISISWPFGGIVALAVLAEGAIGLWRDRRNAAVYE